MLLSDADLSVMRAVTALHRPTPAQILRRTLAPDGWGGSTETWAVISPAGFVCRVAPARPGEEVLAEQRLEARDYWHVAVAWDTDLTAMDRVVAQVGSTAMTFEVVSIGPRSFEIEHSALCVRLL